MDKRRETQTQDRSSDRHAGTGLIRPTVKGKFLYAGAEKLFVRGVTYGTFRPGEDGSEYNKTVVERDFQRIAQNGLNAIRTYDLPPHWLLDTASLHGLRVLVGLPWEQHVTFLEDRRCLWELECRLREEIGALSGLRAVVGDTTCQAVPPDLGRYHALAVLLSCDVRPGISPKPEATHGHGT